MRRMSGSDYDYYRIKMEETIEREIYRRNNHRTSEEILDELPIEDIEKYLRKRKLKNINNK